MYSINPDNNDRVAQSRYKILNWQTGDVYELDSINTQVNTIEESVRDIPELLATFIYVEITSSGDDVNVSYNTSDYMEITVYYNTSSTSTKHVYVQSLPVTTIYNDKPTTILFNIGDEVTVPNCPALHYCYASPIGKDDGVPNKIGLRIGRKPADDDLSYIVSNFWIQVNKCPGNDCGLIAGGDGRKASFLQKKAYSMEPENPIQISTYDTTPKEFSVALLSDWIIAGA